jgi:plasmid replication initiation protein
MKLISYNENLPKHIKKGHQLVFSRQNLSAREADLFALMMACMNPVDWEFNTPSYEFPCAKLSEWLNIDAKHMASTLSPIADRLAEKKVGINNINDNDGLEFDYVPLFKRIRYKQGVLKMIPNDELKNEYIEYHKGFALINTANFLGLKREYSKRLYELLSRFKDNGTSMRTFNINELRGLFGILDSNNQLREDKKSLSNTGVFLRRCVKDSLKEIMDNPQTNKELLFLSCDGRIGYKAITVGKRIVSIEFLYKWVQGTNNINTFNSNDAKKTIKSLELERLQNKTKLTDAQLELLAAAYKSIGEDDTASNIIQDLAKRSESEKQEVEDESLEKLLANINKLKEISGIGSY